MTKKNLLAAILALALVQCVMVGSTLASWTASGKATNRIGTGKLHGTIVEEYTQPKSVYPGDTVKKVVNVKNTGDVDIIARVKVQESWENGLSADNIQINFNTRYWLDGKDGYYYYKGILQPNKTTLEPLFSAFTLAAATDNEYQGKNAQVTVNMECLQAAGNAIRTWSKTYSDLGITEPAAKSGSSEVTFLSPTDKFEFNPRNTDLFDGFQNLVPGEERVQTILVSNSYNKKVEILLRAEAISQKVSGETLTRLNDFLRNYASIEVINDNGKTIYSGAVGSISQNAGSMKNNISLGKFASNEEKDLTVILTIDPTADNEYQGLLGDIQWIFSAKGTDSSQSDDRSTTIRDGDVPLDSEPTVTLAESPVPKTNLPFTGDDGALIWMFAGMAVLATVMAVLILLYFRQKRRDARQG